MRAASSALATLLTLGLPSVQLVYAADHANAPAAVHVSVPYTCRFYPNSARVADVSFADPTIHEATNISRPPDCCRACSDWNLVKPRSATDNCTIGVHFAQNNTCALKATASRPFSTETLSTAVYCQARQLPPSQSRTHMDLIILPNESSIEKGAVCLDGTAPGIYFRAANLTGEPGAETRWVLYLKGGGWYAATRVFGCFCCGVPLHLGWTPLSFPRVVLQVLRRGGLRSPVAHYAGLIDWAGTH
jgi:hypothetical protein